MLYLAEDRKETTGLMKSLKDYKVALVQDWLTGMRGGEKVLEALCEMFPDAPIFTLLHNPGSVSATIEQHPIYKSFIDRLPLKRKHYRSYLPLFPTAVEMFDFSEFDIIISTSHCVAKGIKTPPHSLHISYLHTPMRYVWDMYDEYFGPGKTGYLARKIIPFFANYLRMWDVTSSNRVDYFVANSHYVARRIRKYYRREAAVIHPPVDTDFFSAGAKEAPFYLIVSALVPYKKIDLAIRVFNRRKTPLVIIGIGPEQKKLRQLAGSHISFLDWADETALRSHYASCRALIFPGVEDFGIVPLEAQSCGKPVVAFGKGGALETIIGYDGANEGKCTGIFFPEQTESALNDALNLCEKLSWNAEFIKNHAQKFSKQNFIKKMNRFIGEKAELFEKEELPAL